MKTLVENPPVHNNVSSITGHEQYLEPGNKTLQPVSQIVSVQFRHNHIGEQQINFFRVKLRYGDRLYG